VTAPPPLPRIALLVNAAGCAESAPFLRSDVALFERMWRVNVMGAVAVTQAVLPAMLEAGFGRVVNIASTAALKGYAYVSAYVAAKHALLGLTRSLAQEFARNGVTINAICPGFTATDIVAESIARVMAKTGRSSDEALAEFTRHNPQHRLVRPEEVAEAVLMLCLPGASGINGQAIAVDGGET
jgi:NAD(P)-dependent dehydrogenase (short-subunit alcohol dehydrogenase family)